PRVRALRPRGGGRVRPPVHERRPTPCGAGPRGPLVAPDARRDVASGARPAGGSRPRRPRDRHGLRGVWRRRPPPPPPPRQPGPPRPPRRPVPDRMAAAAGPPDDRAAVAAMAGAVGARLL